MLKIYKAFPEGKHKVLTMSYDDGKFADRKLVGIFNKYGIKGTFHLNSGLLDDGKRIPCEEWQELYKGHEVAAHTLTHPTIARCPSEEIAYEIFEDRKFLESVMKYPVKGLSYPNGSCDERVKNICKTLGIKYARTVGDQYPETLVSNRIIAENDYTIVGDANGFAFPTDFLEWKATCHHNHNLLNYAKQFISLSKRQYMYMMYVWGHSYEFDRDNNWDLIEDFCKMIGGRDDIWYATNMEIVDYMERFDRLEFAADLSFVYNPSAKPVWIIVNDKNTVCIPGGETVFLQ